MLFHHLPLVLSIAVVVLVLPTAAARSAFIVGHHRSGLHADRIASTTTTTTPRRRRPSSSSPLPETSASASASSSNDNGGAEPTLLGKPVCIYENVTIKPSSSGGSTRDDDAVPRQAVSVTDLTPRLHSILSSSSMRNGVVHIISRHTTTAITINELESRLARDVENYFLELCPPDERSSRMAINEGGGVRYLHNDIDERPEGDGEAERCRANGWDVDDPVELKRWRDQEPINAHSHLISMMLGSSECIPVVEGEMVIGQWQSVLLVDLDGPRTRTVGVQLMGYE